MCRIFYNLGEKTPMTRTLLLAILVSLLHSSARSQSVPPGEARIRIEGPATDENYGRIPDSIHAIKVSSINGEYRFIAMLTGPKGQKIRARRLGSCCEYQSDKGLMGFVILDKWEIKYKGLKKPIILYLNGYDSGEIYCPVGLDWKKEAVSTDSPEISTR